MKTAISVPDGIFKKAERLAKLLKTSRSDLYSRALEEYLARHSPDEVTNALNDLSSTMDTRTEPDLKRTARRLLGKSEW